MTVAVSTLPPLLGPVVWITGIEDRPNGAMRVYVGPRYLGRYFLPEPEDREPIRHAWGAGGHVWMRPGDLEGVPIFREDG
jgi:hypothetical protein